MATRKFLVGNAFFVPDKVAGWRNKPNVAIRNWVTDARGCRFAHQQLGLAKKPMRMMMLGSSMVNGGTGVRNDQTISAYLEDDRVEVLNFGTMMYSMDQCLLRYRAEIVQVWRKGTNCRHRVRAYRWVEESVCALSDAR